MRKRIPDKQKMIACARVEHGGELQADVARDLGVTPSAIYQWRMYEFPEPKVEWLDPFASLPLHRQVQLYNSLKKKVKEE